MIDLPDHPQPASATPGLIDFGAFLTPALGGPVQRVERMGTRWRIACQMPPMSNPKLGRQWIARLVRGKQEGVRMPWPLQGFEPGSPGPVVVHTVAMPQTGRSLIVNGATPNYIFREGQFFSHLARSGQRYLYMVTAETIATALGAATLSIEPMIRSPAEENDPLNFGNPVIEGFIMGEQFAWDMALANFVGLSFDIVEIE